MEQLAGQSRYSAGCRVNFGRQPSTASSSTPLTSTRTHNTEEHLANHVQIDRALPGHASHRQNLVSQAHQCITSSPAAFCESFQAEAAKQLLDNAQPLLQAYTSQAFRSATATR